MTFFQRIRLYWRVFTLTWRIPYMATPQDLAAIDADAKAMFDGSTGCKGNPASFDQSTLAVAVSAQAYVCKDEKVIEAYLGAGHKPH